MNAQTPLISIIMPTYNAAQYIGRAIESVLAQTYPHWELLIIDDASSDHTESIVHNYPDSRIQYYKVDRIGHPAGVRNVGLQKASGELLAFLDSDDLYFPKSLESLAKPLLSQPTLAAAYGFAWFMDEHENPLPQPIQLIPNPEPHTGEQYSLPSHYNHSWKSIVTSQISCLLSALMLRRSTQEKIGFFNEALGGVEDYEYYVRLFLQEYENIAIVSDYAYRYRIHSKSLTKAPEHCAKLLNCCLQIFEWLFHHAGIPEEAQAYRSEAYVGCYRYLARERILHNQPHLARKIIVQAFKERNILRRDFFIQCTPLLLRSWLPTSIDRWFVSSRQQLRKFYHSVIRPSLPHKPVVHSL